MQSALGVLAEFPPPGVVRDLKRGVVAASAVETASVFGAGAADERVAVLRRGFVMVVVGAEVQKGVVGAFEGHFSIIFFFNRGRSLDRRTLIAEAMRQRSTKAGA